MVRLVMFIAALLTFIALIAHEIMTPPHDPYSRPERRFAAPALAVPEGCRMFRTHFGDELTKACDKPQTRLDLADDFDIHVRSYKTSYHQVGKQLVRGRLRESMARMSDRRQSGRFLLSANPSSAHDVEGA